MYPAGELKLIEARKAVLQARIALQRAEFAADLSRLVEPLAQVDAWWNRLRPLQFAFPVGAALLRNRAGLRRGSGRSGWRKWLPIGYQILKAIVRTRAGRARAEG